MNYQTKSILNIIIGAGGIVQTAHLPAYQLAGFEVKGIFDIDNDKAKIVAEKFGFQTVYPSLEDAIATGDGKVVFDIAVPASGIIPVLQKIPAYSAILLQKPMGEDLRQAKAIESLCRQNNRLPVLIFNCGKLHLF